MNFSKKNHELKMRNRDYVSKTVITFVLVSILSMTSQSQEKNIETESVSLDNLITFIVENYSIQTDSSKTKNITFLIETYADSFNIEDSVILKQAFKLLTKRVTDEDVLSIVTFSSFSGIALSQVQATDIKKLMYVIEHPKSSVKVFEEDGIELAYKFTKENFVQDSENSVVMIRIPNRASEVVNTESTNSKNAVKKKKSNAVVLTAIAILPEIIAIIKD